MTIFQNLTWANDVLKTTLSPVQNPKLDAQTLLAFVLEKGTAYLFAHGDDDVMPTKEEMFRDLVVRRSRHEPIAYLCGKKEFYGREFFVTPATLIPRPDTETLVDAAKKIIAGDTLVVDVGTGSGAIAVTLACDTIRPVIAIDESDDALVVAKKNAARHGVDKRIAFLSGNLLSPLIAENSDDALGAHVVIVANLPYISLQQFTTLDPDITAFEPRRALVSGIDGLDHYDALFTQLALRRGAFPARLDVCIEIDPSQKLSAVLLIQKHFPDASPIVHNDLSGKPRVIVVHCPDITLQR